MKSHSIYQILKSISPALFLVALPLHADTITWKGDAVGDNDNWANTDNWDGGVLPGGDDKVILGSAGNKVIYIGDATRTIDVLSINSATSYTVNLQDKSNITEEKETKLELHKIEVLQGNHTIHGLSIGVID